MLKSTHFEGDFQYQIESIRVNLNVEIERVMRFAENSFQKKVLLSVKSR